MKYLLISLAGNILFTSLMILIFEKLGLNLHLSLIITVPFAIYLGWWGGKKVSGY